MASKVIVIDDSSSIRAQISALLGPAGFEIIEAEDGHQGLARIAQHVDAKLVICDLNMPKLGGLGLLAVLSGSKRAERTPFLMLTTEAQPEVVRKAKEHGARGWIQKPFRADQLLQAVRRLTA
jgi:two-component system chemotaxis response regulator CheY